MGSSLSRSVEIQISNRTQNITLMNPRTFCGLGYCYKRPQPELSPGSSDTCHFWGDPVLWGVWGTRDMRGILVYEAESFTLAIYFFNPSDHDKSFMHLGLELSPGKAHLDDLRATYTRMAEGTYSNSGQDIKFIRVTLGKSHGTAQVSHGPIKVMATMSRNTSSTLKVVLEEQRGSGEEYWGENPWADQGDESMSFEDEYQYLFPSTAPEPQNGVPASTELRRRL